MVMFRENVKNAQEGSLFVKRQIVSAGIMEAGAVLERGAEVGHVGLDTNMIIIDDPMEARDVQVRVIEPVEGNYHEETLTAQQKAVRELNAAVAKFWEELKKTEIYKAMLNLAKIMGDRLDGSK